MLQILEKTNKYWTIQIPSSQKDILNIIKKNIETQNKKSIFRIILDKEIEIAKKGKVFSTTDELFKTLKLKVSKK